VRYSLAKKDDAFPGKKNHHGHHHHHEDSSRKHGDSDSKSKQDDILREKDKPARPARSSQDTSYSKWSEKYDRVIASGSKGIAKSKDRRPGKENDDEDENDKDNMSLHQGNPLSPGDDFETASLKIDQEIASTLRGTVFFQEKRAKAVMSTETVVGESDEADEGQGTTDQPDIQPITPIDLTDSIIAKKTKLNASTVSGKNPGLESTSSDGTVAVKATDDELNQLEQEMTIDTNVDRCIVCKKELAGDVFICPNCKNAKYHKSCIEALIANGEPCWVCQTHFISEQAEKEVKALQLRLNYIERALEDLSAQFKSGEISGEMFTETFNQFKQDKNTIEKQIGAKLKKEPKQDDEE